MVSICVPLQTTLCFELYFGVTVVAQVRVSFHMKALNVSHHILLVVEGLLANSTAPKLHAALVQKADALLFNIRRDSIMLHVN